MPSAPNDMMAAFASARRGSGTHSTTALKPLISPPAKPRPIRARAQGQGRAVLADGEQQRACGGAREQRRLDATRAEAVEQDAERQLEQGEREQIGRREQAQLGGAQAEIGGQVRPDDRVHRPEQVGQEVAERERRQDR